MDIIQDVLIYQTQMMRNSSLGPYVPPHFSPPEYIVVVNALFYASLGLILLAAFFAMLIIGWLREFDRGLYAISIPEQRAKTREFRYLGMERWKIPEMIAILPLLIQTSLLLFSIGLTLLLFHISKPSFCVIAAICGVGVLYYAITTSVSVFVTSSPFQTPPSRFLGVVFQRLHAYFCPPVDFFLSRAMDTTPSTALGRVRRDIQIFLLKSRPYLEKCFVEPITSTTMDEIHLYTSVSALWRIHEQVSPILNHDSQQSDALQHSVWQVASSVTPRISPFFNLPSWILVREQDEDYFSGLDPATVVALVAVSLRAPRKRDVGRIRAARAVLQRAEKTFWSQLVITVFDRVHATRAPRYEGNMAEMPHNDLTNMIRRSGLHRDECLWLLATLSELRSGGWLSGQEPFLIEVCIAILSRHAREWGCRDSPDIVLLEAVVTLAAMTFNLDGYNRLNILTSSLQYPWLLLNIRNPALFGRWFQDTPPDYRKELTSLLFLVLYSLILRGSYPLAVQYFNMIKANGDLPLYTSALYTSALVTIAPSMNDRGLSAIGRMLLAPWRPDLRQIIDDSMDYRRETVQQELDSRERTAQEILLQEYDHQLGTEIPDSNILAILLVLLKHLPSDTIEGLQDRNGNLTNYWLRLLVRVVAQLDYPDGPGVPTWLFNRHRVHTMIAAQSLLRYTTGAVTLYTEPLLASFLECQEFSISSIALAYYIKTAIANPDPPAPSCYLSHAVHAVFNRVLPDNQLWVGWEILETLVNGFEDLPMEWRRTFSDAFFTLSRQPLPRQRGDMDSSTQASELEKIVTWEYFHEEEQERQLTDSDFSGLDWMVMAWSLYLSQVTGRKIEGSGQGKAQSQNLSGPAVNEEFVLRALCKLLEVAPNYQIIPITPKLREFVQWFDDNELATYRCVISKRMEEAARMLHRFDKFHCMWYI